MKLFRFLELTYIEKNMALQKDFDLKLQAQTKACHELIDLQRRWFKFVARFELLWAYLKARFTGIYPEMPVIEEKKTENKPAEA